MRRRDRPQRRRVGVVILLFDGGGRGRPGAGRLPPGPVQRRPYRPSHPRENEQGDSSALRPGRVDFDLGVPPSCPVAQPFLPYSHQPKQNWADGGTT